MARRFQWSLRAMLVTMGVLAAAVAAALGVWVRLRSREARLLEELYEQLEGEARYVSVVNLAEEPGYRVILRDSRLSRASVELMAARPAVREVLFEGVAEPEAESKLEASFGERAETIASMRVFQRKP
jgi:hypothetical protein